MDVFDRAAAFALEAHMGMTRKRETIPFILHPMEVATITATLTTDRDVIAAALLHDTVEDTPTTAEQILENFGPRVAELVASETENKRPDMPASESWRIRKEESLDELAATSDLDVKRLWLADKLSNMRSFYRLYQREGSKLWDRFHQHDPAEQHWYYRRVAELTSELKETQAWKEYCFLMAKVFESEADDE